MKPKKLLFIFLIVSVSLFGQFKYDNELFGLYFPDKPVEEKYKMKVSDKKIYLYTLTSYDNKGCGFTVNYYEYPENSAGYNPISILTSTAEGFVEEKSILLQEEIQKFKQKGDEGVEFSGYSLVDSLYYDYRSYLHNNFVIQIAILNQNDYLNKKLVRNFFKGFKLN